MNCPKCGTENEDDAKVCYRCYFPLKKSQERDRMVASPAKGAIPRPKQSYNRQLIYVPIIVVLGIIGIVVVSKTFLSENYNKVKVYEGTEDISKNKGSKQSVLEIAALFKQMDEVLRRDEMIEAVKLQSKEFRELFNSRSLQERMVILASMKFGTAGFTDCKTVVKSITFQDSEKMQATVVTISKCRNPSTGNTMENEYTFPIVKEEDGWKIDMMAFMRDFDERLKVKPKAQDDPTLTPVTALFRKWDEAFNTKDADKLMEIITDEVKERIPESKTICTEMINEITPLAKNMNTTVDRIVIENEEGTEATAHVTHSGIDLKSRSPFTGSASYPVTKEAGEWKLDIERWIRMRQAKSLPAEQPKPRSGLVVSLSFEGWKRGYHVYSAETYNSGDKTESISPSSFVLVNDRNESIEAQIPFERPLADYKNLLNLSILPKTRTKGYLFFKTASQAQYIVFLPTGEKIPISSTK